jgi:succinate dehydrogenase / fumarate reductase membrane anchor subunit
MRVTGVLLFVMALAHFSIMHFIWDPAEQTAEFVTRERWSNLFWRAYDWTLLMLVLFHSFVGMRTVILDYIHGVRARLVIMSAMWILAGILFVIGTLVVVTLPGLEI